MEVSARVKFLWMLVAIFVVWQVFRIPVVLDAFLTFCTAGVVPGLHGALSPEAVARLLIALFTLSFLLTFRTEIAMSLPYRQKRVRTQKFTGQLPVIPLQHPSKMLQPKTAKVARNGLYRKLGRNTSMRLHQVKAAVVYVSRRVIFAAKRFALWVWPIVRLATTVTAHKIKRFCIILWRFIEPGIRTIDRLIDKKLHNYKPTSEILEIAAVCWSALIEMCQKIGRHARRSAQE